MAPTLVFLLQFTSAARGSESTYVVSAHASLEGAQKRAEGRSGRKLPWTRHDSHGVSWTSDTGYSVSVEEIEP